MLGSVAERHNNRHPVPGSAPKRTVLTSGPDTRVDFVNFGKIRRLERWYVRNVLCRSRVEERQKERSHGKAAGKV